VSAPSAAQPGAIPTAPNPDIHRGEPLALAPDAREMRGPRAFGGTWKRFFDLTWMIGVNQYRLTFFGSALGYVWSLMRPLMMFGVLYIVFTEVVKFGGSIQHYAAMLLTNMVLFNLFTEGTQRAVTCVLDSEGLVRKMHFPRLVIPLATVLTSVLNLALSLVAVLLLVFATGVEVRWTWLLLPVIIVPLVVYTAAVSMLVSSLFVRFRDVAPIWLVASTALVYASPVLYPITSVPASYQRYVLFNPLAMMLTQTRNWVIDAHAPNAIDAIGGWGWALVPICILLGTLALSVWVFNREAPRIAERL
jgi:ABC-2 type transport system permease protein